jgi:hypothetical protein
MAAADIHPHVFQTRHDVRITGQAHTTDVKQYSGYLIRHSGVGMLQPNGIADVFYFAIKNRLGIIVHVRLLY